MTLIMGMSASGISAETKTDSFEGYYKNVLVKKDGMFKKSQTGTMRTHDDQWMHTTGILGYSICDFDMDDTKEMLVLQAESIGSQTSSHIVMKMYEKEKGKIQKISEMPFQPYSDKKIIDAAAGGITLPAANWTESSFIISVVQKKGHCYLVCEEKQVWGCFANGAAQDYWILEYKNNKLQYVRSFTQTAGGSSDFEYTGITFSNGKLKKSELYYADGAEWIGKKTKYKNYQQAIKGLFSQCGIALNKNATQYKLYDGNNKTILAKTNKPKILFNFHNRLTNKGNYNIFKFKATVTADRR